MYDLAEEVGINRDETYSIADYLSGEGLIKIETHQGGISITHEGMVQMESMISEPDKPIGSFLSLNIIHVDSMSQSQIQQSTIESTQIYNYSEGQLRSLSEFLQELRDRDRISELELDEDKTAELEAEISTLQAQSRSPSPKHRIIGEAIASIRAILENAAGSAAAVILLQRLAEIP